MNKVFTFIIQLPKKITLVLIAAYQRLLSPDHSWLKGRYPYGYCRHYPSCSEYSKQAITTFGFLKGLWLTLKRISSCHPWAEPKIDLVPKTF
jgi:putative membrane protein insertion efficiency factor